MRRILWSCMIIGVINVILAILNVRGILLSPKGIFNEIVSLILPFLSISVSLSAICDVIPKFAPFIKSFLSPFIGCVISAILFTSGIGLILQRRWSKIFAHIYAISIISISIIGLPLVLAYYKKEFTHIEKYGFFEGLIWGGALLYILTLIGTLLYPIFLLIFFSRPKIKELFKK